VLAAATVRSPIVRAVALPVDTRAMSLDCSRRTTRFNGRREAEPFDPGGDRHSCLDLSRRTGGGRLAFGFVERVRIGENHRAQLRFGDGAVIVADVRGDRRPPRPGEVTHSVTVRVEDVRSDCAGARASGARILMEPTDFEYGERQYSAEDPAGHQWTFSETLAGVAPEQ
jgi:uncharacterized glyoxalase superfamily protein PhnB